MVKDWYLILILIIAFDAGIWYLGIVVDLINILKANLLLVGVLSGKLVLDLAGYAKLKKVELYNNLYEKVNIYTNEIINIISNINSKLVKKVNEGKLTPRDKEYFDFIKEVYKLIELFNILYVLKVNIENTIIVDKKLKNNYYEYIRSIIRMGLKEKGILINGNWASDYIKTIICGNCPYKEEILQDLLLIKC